MIVSIYMDDSYIKLKYHNLATMGINLRHFISGRIKIGRKVVDIWNLQIRDELSYESIHKYAIECAEKVKLDPRFNGDDNKLKIDMFYKDLAYNVRFIAAEPDWISVPIIILYKKDTPGPKAIIMVPNDYEPGEAKGSTFHETLHFLGVYTGGDVLFNDERLVDDIVDSYIYDDKHALFEHRWLRYSLTPKIKIAITVVYLTMGFISGILVGHGHFDIVIIV